MSLRWSSVNLRIEFTQVSIDGLVMARVKHGTVLITGSASGLGRALAREFAIRGAKHLVLVDRDKPNLDKTKELIEAKSLKTSSIETFVCDLSSKSELHEIFLNKIFSNSRSHGLDVLVNCAGITHIGSFEEMDLNDFEKVIAVNLLAAVRTTHICLTKLRKSKNPAIINVSSLAGLIGAPEMVAYSTSKFGLMGFTESLRTELDGKVHLLSVSPSLIKTAIAKNAAGVRQKQIQKNRLDRILNRFGTSPEKAAVLIVDALEKQKTELIINPDAHVMYALKRFLPSSCQALVQLGFRRLKKSGVL